MDLRIFLNGAFKVLARDGADRTPRGAKECALLALLVTSRNGERARGWLQAMLWSDRGREQAAASLRQAILQIRKAFGDDSDLLLSNRRAIGLKLDRIEVFEETGHEFLEGLDVRDDEFEHWLIAERLSRDSVSRARLPASAARAASESEAGARAEHGSVLAAGARQLALPELIVIKSGSADGARAWTDRLVADAVARTLGGSFSLPLLRNPLRDPDGPFWTVDIATFGLGEGRTGLRLSLSDADCDANGVRDLWSSVVAIGAGAPPTPPAVSETPELLTAMRELAGAVAERLGNDVDERAILEDPDIMCCLAIRKLFTMRAAEAALADRLFARAFELRPRGLYLAWRALVREIQFIERIVDDIERVREEGVDFARRAVDLEPRNATVLAIQAIVRLYLGGELQDGLDFAQRAVTADYSDPVAWWAFAAAHVAAKDSLRAYECAGFAARLAQGTPMEFLTKSLLAGAAIALRRHEEATGLMTSVSLSRPDFRPPLRYLVALHATRENWEGALAAADRMSAIEPGFSIDRMINDDDYPTSLLREGNGFDRDRIGSLK